MKPINKFCPRSGKAVEGDSLTQYRQYTVGFCNPNCRDSFAKDPQGSVNVCAYFDVLIKENYS